MKKVLSTLLIALLCAALMLGVLTGCGKQELPGSDSTTEGSNTTGGNETPDEPVGGDEEKLLTWEEYQALSDTEKDEYHNSFEDESDFVEWYNDAYNTYEENKEYIVLDPNNPVIDIGELLK